MGGREGGRGEGGREGGHEGGRKEGRERGRKGGREGRGEGRNGWRELNTHVYNLRGLQNGDTLGTQKKTMNQMCSSYRDELTLCGVHTSVLRFLLHDILNRG